MVLSLCELFKVGFDVVETLEATVRGPANIARKKIRKGLRSDFCMISISDE